VFVSEREHALEELVVASKKSSVELALMQPSCE